MWWGIGIGLPVVVLCILAFLISRAGTLSDRAIGRDPEAGSTAKDVATDEQLDLQPDSSEDQIPVQPILDRKNRKTVSR